MAYFHNMTGAELRARATAGPRGKYELLSQGMEVSSHSISNKLIAQRDVAIIDAITERLNHDKWTVDGIRERLIFQEQSGVTTIVFDGHPIMRFEQPRFHTNQCAGYTELVGTQRFRRY